MSVSDRDKKKFSSLLLSEKDKILSEQAKELLIEGQGDALDQSLAQRENSITTACHTRKSSTLYRINQALEKLETEEFGLCEECGNKIERKRLVARPFTENCIECREALEREQINQVNHRSPSWGSIASSSSF